jgi:hypothetical protein
MKKIVPHWCRCEVSYPEAMAIKAMATGTANEGQQKLFMTWMMSRAANVLSVAFDPDNDRASAFESGRRYVGLKINEVIGTPADFYKDKDVKPAGRSASNHEGG